MQFLISCSFVSGNMDQPYKIRHLCVETRNHNRSIFKLNDDCFENIFNWLSLKDLNLLAKTCKRLHKITGKYFQQHFAAIKVQYGKDGPFAFDAIRVDTFSQLVQRLSINRVDLRSFRDIQTKFKSLKEIHLVGVRLTLPKVQCLKEILRKIEILEIRDIEIEVNFYENFLKFCNNLKRLSIRNLSIKEKRLHLKINDNCSNLVTTNKWLHQKYPKLKHFELTGMEGQKFCDLLTFFKENPNICSFSTDTKFLSRFEHLITEADVKLEDLTIVREYNDDLVNDSIFYSLNHLYKRGLYKHLHWNGAYLPFDGRPLQNQIDQISQLRSLKSLRFKTLVYVIPHVNLLQLTKVKMLSMVDPQMGTNIENLASELLNLERISFTHAFLNDIIPFVTRSKKLKEIHLNGDIRSADNIIHLKVLNEVRANLVGACKVTIHANDKIFTETKWANAATQFGLVELKRC